jgi:8-oxo-dGTP diphosphatase
MTHIVGPMTGTLKEYIKHYDATEYPSVLVTVDTVLLTYNEDAIKVLLVKRASHPYIGLWGLPGGFLDQSKDKSLDDAANRNIEAKTNIRPLYLEQIQTIGSGNRDPRGWSISVIFSALIPIAACNPNADSVEEARWFDIDEARKLNLAFDHKQAIEVAFERHKQKALYSFIPVYALTQPMTLTELRRVHELLIGKKIQRKSFIRRVEASDMFIDTGKSTQDKGRPAALYKVKSAVKDYRFVRNIEV